MKDIYNAGSGYAAYWSFVNQAYIVRPYNPDWSIAVQEAAPVLGTCRDKAEVEDRFGKEEKS